ncbi:MAG: hypothetical protein M1817_004354 [Caeruleum heppii]|nr:MAG: hypothetical protein M1817_004354 [Caeruleum heppii]
MDGANLGPVPSRLCFLSDLPSARPGDKVRFLGCVSRYLVSSGCLSLHHAFPVSGPLVEASVDVNVLLSTLKSTDTQTGEWLNVIGYVNGTSVVEERKRGRQREAMQVVHVQAIVLWSAGSIKLGEYERILHERQRIERRR